MWSDVTNFIYTWLNGILNLAKSIFEAPLLSNAFKWLLVAFMTFQFVRLIVAPIIASSGNDSIRLSDNLRKKNG